VKLYDEGQIGMFSGRRILFRMDLPWPDNWEAFRTSVRQRAANLAALGVDAIEVHNEPNLANEWPHGPNAWEYTQMLRVVYTEVMPLRRRSSSCRAGWLRRLPPQTGARSVTSTTR
jgi:hypothetical protein